MKDLTVIVPVYNVEKYLEKSLDSLVNQTYKNLEIIIVNDGSTDSSREILKKYEYLENVQIYDKENEGVSSARKLALGKVKTEYVTFFDSDDFIDLDLYELSMYKMKENRNIDILMFNFYIHFNGQKQFSSIKSTEEFTHIKNPVKSLLLFELSFVLWNKIYKTSLFDGINIPKGGNHEDTLILSYLVSKCSYFVFLNKHKYHYFKRNSSLSYTPTNYSMSLLTNYILMIEKLIKESDNYENLSIELEFFKAYMILTILRRLTLVKEEKIAPDILTINLNLKLLYKARKLYKINNRQFLINLLYIFNKNLSFNIMKLIRTIKNSNKNDSPESI